MSRNVELKARDPDPSRSLATCGSLGALHQGVLIQRDTYFKAQSGRLKLREEDGAGSRLIAYARPNVVEQRESRYRIVEVEQSAELKAALSETLGVDVVVVKRRRLFLWEQVRIHLDEVEGLGSFLEFEAVATPDSDLSPEEERVRRLHEAFDVDEADLISVSYSDLMRVAR